MGSIVPTCQGVMYYVNILLMEDAKPRVTWAVGALMRLSIYLCSPQLLPEHTHNCCRKLRLFLGLDDTMG